MTKGTWMVAASASVLCAGAALATPTPQQKCDNARITAWTKYVSCVDTVVAKEAKGIVFDQFAAFAKCRHTYFKKWTAFQISPSFALTTCRGSRYTDQGTTVADNLSGLMWEKKDTGGSYHDTTHSYTWSFGSPYYGNGSAYYSFLTAPNTSFPPNPANGGLNASSFGGATDWRLPTLAELQTIELDFPCTGLGGGSSCSCPSSPCVDPALDTATTQSGTYWSATSYARNPAAAWDVFFTTGGVFQDAKTDSAFVRAVRGGL